MFKSTRWRGDKNKVKAVFQLQFHATQIPPNGGDALTIAVIPDDIRKPTARLERTKVRDGSCYWEKPHSETVKFTRDHKTGKINAKIYRFVVATGSTIFGVVGEVSLDFSCYADAAKPSSVSLPLKNAKSTSVLHVSVQRVQDRREVDASENVNEDKRAQFSTGDIKGSIQSEDHVVLRDNITRDHGTSSRSDITLSSSDSTSGLDTQQEPESKNTKLAHETSTTTICEEQHQRSSQWDWLDDFVHDLSADDSSMISSRETLEGPPDDVSKKLKDELEALARQPEVSEMELQTLRKQIVKESKMVVDLSDEVASLKEERNELKEECEKMKVKFKVNGNLLTEGENPWALVDELKQELNFEKDLNFNLRLQLQKTQESNAELILAIKELESHISNLDNQAHGAMEDLIHAKVEQEQRAIHAEENLRKVKLQTACTASKLQEEFKKLSIEMASTFQERENAIDEANQLRIEKLQLEELVKRVKEEFDFLWNRYEIELGDLSNQITLKSKHLEKMKKQIENLSHGLNHQKTSYNAKIENLEDERNYLEGQIKLKETALECSEALFLEKEKDLKHMIEELERRLEVLDQNIENSQVSTAQNSNHSTISNDVIKPEIKRTGDQEIFEVLSNEMELLNKNKSMENELKEMQERYSEISLKFAEVEGERQQLVMTLRSIKNKK